jgi:hypothetical protein
MKKIVFISFLFISIFSNAQNKKEGGVVILSDEKIDELVTKRSNMKKMTSTGYRIQIFFSEDKEELNNMRLKFIKQFPKIETYITFDAPNYLLRVGDFADKNQAEKFKKEIQQLYPENFILKTNINISNEPRRKEVVKTEE